MKIVYFYPAQMLIIDVNSGVVLVLNVMEVAKSLFFLFNQFTKCCTHSVTVLRSSFVNIKMLSGR